MVNRKFGHFKSKVYLSLPLLAQKKLFDLNYIGKNFK